MNPAKRKQQILSMFKEHGPMTWEQLRQNFFSDEKMIVMVNLFRLIDSGAIIAERDSTLGQTTYFRWEDMQ